MDDRARPLLLANLIRYRREAMEARARYQRQLEACIAADYDSVEIAEAIKVQSAAIRNTKVWKERKR